MSKKRCEIRLLPPRRVPLSVEQERDAVAVLAEVLLDVARKRRASVSGGDLAGGSGGAIGTDRERPCTFGGSTDQSLARSNHFGGRSIYRTRVVCTSRQRFPASVVA